MNQNMWQGGEGGMRSVEYGTIQPQGSNRFSIKVGNLLNPTEFLDPVFVIYVLCDSRTFNICKMYFIHHRVGE